MSEKLKMWWRYTRKLFSINEDTDIEATMTTIRNSVEFRGTNAWVLVFAIIIASIGLNVNSTAVIIGAMLISPLMAPITGVGLAVGTFDIELLKRSARNLALMVGISLFASTLYFLLSPLGDAQSELLARTRPTIFDVLVAVFGGLAGIVASSRKTQPFTVISGVAIATALMPPLCTAGYGLATWQLRYFFGAFYLFFINSFFIALATFVMVRYLHFPRYQFMDARSERFVKRSIVVISIIISIPSILAAINVVRETLFDTQVSHFVSDLRNGELLEPGTVLMDYQKNYDRKSPTLTLSVIGAPISVSQLDTLRNTMRMSYGLTSTELTVHQRGIDLGNEQQTAVLENLLRSKEDELRGKESQILSLKDSLQRIGGCSASYSEKAALIGERYREHISEISIVDVPYYSVSSGRQSKRTTIYIVWRNNADRQAVINGLSSWAPVVLNVSSVDIVSAN